MSHTSQLCCLDLFGSLLFPFKNYPGITFPSFPLCVSFSVCSKTFVSLFEFLESFSITIPISKYKKNNPNMSVFFHLSEID